MHGNDRACTSKEQHSGSSNDHQNDALDEGDFFVPCLLNKGSLPPSAELRSLGVASDSKSVNSNHDSLCRQDPLGQGDCKHVSNEYAKPRSIDKVMATSQEGIHVSPTACSFARALMAEGTANHKRRKKSDPIGSKSDTSSVAHTPEGSVVSAATNPRAH
ncbi:hypothetical protein Ancab_007610 [Ancistrocladus abbreviatus]